MINGGAFGDEIDYGGFCLGLDTRNHTSRVCIGFGISRPRGTQFSDDILRRMDGGLCCGNYLLGTVSLSTVRKAIFPNEAWGCQRFCATLSPLRSAKMGSQRTNFKLNQCPEEYLEAAIADYLRSKGCDDETIQREVDRARPFLAPRLG
jgi:hypothetical protein